MIVDIQDLKQALHEGVVRFTFVKKDGSVRNVRGTTCPDLVPVDNMPQGKRSPGTQAKYDQQTVAFYDIDKKAWRSMRIDTLWKYERALKLQSEGY